MTDTLALRASHLLEVKHSRFLALAAPVTTPDEALAGITPATAQVAAAWQAKVEAIFASATLPVPAAASYFYLNARKGLHTEHLGILLAEMQFLPRAYPDATW